MLTMRVMWMNIYLLLMPLFALLSLPTNNPALSTHPHAHTLPTNRPYNRLFSGCHLLDTLTVTRKVLQQSDQPKPMQAVIVVAVHNKLTVHVYSQNVRFIYMKREYPHLYLLIHCYKKD